MKKKLSPFVQDMGYITRGLRICCVITLTTCYNSYVPAIFLSLDMFVVAIEQGFI